jgi:polyribonucleotide nucleotidyltransferase
MSYITKEFELNNIKEIYEFNKVAKQADCAVLLREGESVVLAAVAVEDERVEEDFLPLTVQYIEKAYAAGKIPGGFVKRETKPGDFETLTSRVIDRSLRPLFPKGFNYPVVITVMVLSCADNADLQRISLNAASAALYTSTLPIDMSVTGIRIGKNKDGFIINPTLDELENGTLDLFVAGTKDQLLMIEMKVNSSEDVEVLETGMVDSMLDPMGSEEIITSFSVNELSEDELIKALELAGDAILQATTQYTKAFADVIKPKKEYHLLSEIYDEEIYQFIKDNFSKQIKKATNQLAKSERSSALKNILQEILKTKEWDDEQIDVVEAMLNLVKREIVRSQILDEGIRADGRKLNEVREISIETNILPKAHSSVLFTRGQTQALAVLTLGSDQDMQAYEHLTSSSTQYERLMLNYNFPGFCVGEAKPLRAPGRRELGHGNLAKRAIECTIRPEFDMSARIVSEILESNGSSSMATVCASSLSLKAANVPTQKLIAGVAMGLITDENRYAILTDIMGLEDHDGDMDFKVAGSQDGITALQMDIKLGGISYEILKEALYQAREARLHILNIMQEAEKNIVINEKVLPTTVSFDIDASKIVDIIGQAGKTIKEIIEKFEVAIDLDREKGGVKVQGRDKDKVEGAVEHIKNIVSKSFSRGGFNKRQNSVSNSTVDYKKGEIIPVKIEKILKFGALAKLPDGNTGMIHISKLANKRVEKVEDIVQEGDEVNVHFVEQSNDGKISLALEGVKF